MLLASHMMAPRLNHFSSTSVLVLDLSQQIVTEWIERPIASIWICRSYTISELWLIIAGRVSLTWLNWKFSLCRIFVVSTFLDRENNETDLSVLLLEIDRCCHKNKISETCHIVLEFSRRLTQKMESTSILFHVILIFENNKRDASQVLVTNFLDLCSRHKNQFEG